MNAIHAKLHADTPSIRRHPTAATPLAIVTRWLRNLALRVRTALERRSTEADEKARRRTLRRYRRNQSVLGPGSFHFDPRQDDGFARTDR